MNDEVKPIRMLAGVVFLLVPALLVWLSVAVYNKTFTSVEMVTLRTASAGSEMHPHADVKLRGVVIGEVRDVTADGETATLKLAMDPDKIDLLPKNVTAQMLPTTLFGQRFVELVPPPNPSSEPLGAGDVITQDRSKNAIELQQVLDNLMPMLTAVKPADLALTLSAVSQALEGRGDKLGTTMVQLESYLKKMEPELPELNKAIRELAAVSHAYNDAAPDVLKALEDFAATSRTIVAQRGDLSAMYASVTDGSHELTDFFRENSSTMIKLADHSLPTLELLKRYSPEFPCLFRMLNDFKPLMDRALGQGTGKPGLQVDVQVVESKGRYKPGKDRPKYNAGGGPRCHAVPYGSNTVKYGGLGPSNSPGENAVINELLAAQYPQNPDALPDWSSVLVGPLFRGTEVKLK